MPYYRRTHRYATRVVGKQKFSTFNNSRVVQPLIPQAGEGSNFTSVILIQNTAQQLAFVPPIMKIKHLKVTIQFPGQMQSIVDNNIATRAYLMFVPEGYDLLNGSDVDNQGQIVGVIKDHPEWIMQSKAITFDTLRVATASFYSRINRNLNSGDRICLVLLTQWLPNLQGVQKPLNITGTVNFSYATRSN